jgi:hypothetical protein
VRGLRISVATIVALVAEGQTRDEILALYPESKTSARRSPSPPRQFVNACFRSLLRLERLFWHLTRHHRRAARSLLIVARHNRGAVAMSDGHVESVGAAQAMRGGQIAGCRATAAVSETRVRCGEHHADGASPMHQEIRRTSLSHLAQDARSMGLQLSHTDALSRAFALGLASYVVPHVTTLRAQPHPWSRCGDGTRRFLGSELQCTQYGRIHAEALKGAAIHKNTIATVATLLVGRASRRAASAWRACGKSSWWAALTALATDRA